MWAGIEEDIVGQRTTGNGVTPRLDSAEVSSLERSAERVLNTDEVSAVLRHINKVGFLDAD